MRPREYTLRPDRRNSDGICRSLGRPLTSLHELGLSAGQLDQKPKNNQNTFTNKSRVRDAVAVKDQFVVRCDGRHTYEYAPLPDSLLYLTRRAVPNDLRDRGGTTALTGAVPNCTC